MLQPRWHHLIQWLLLTTVVRQCSSNMEAKMVNGDLAHIIDYPHSVYLTIVELKSQTSTNCGGSLISSQTILTASHCLDELQQSSKFMRYFKILAFFGDSDYRKPKQVRRIIDFVAHQNYDTAAVTNDVAVLFMEKPVKFLKPIKKALLSVATPSNGQMAHIAGWGVTEQHYEDVREKMSRVLRKVQLPIMTASECSQYILLPKKGVFCAGEENGESYAYKGDSGSALLVGNVQVGILSFMRMGIHINVFTNVAYYYRWIRRTNIQLFRKHCRSVKK